MPSLVLAGVLDHGPQLAICHDGPDLRRALADWFGDLVPDLDLHRDDPRAIEEKLDAAMAPSDWTALACFPLIEDGLAFTGEALTIGQALERQDAET